MKRQFNASFLEKIVRNFINKDLKRFNGLSEEEKDRERERERAEDGAQSSNSFRIADVSELSRYDEIKGAAYSPGITAVVTKSKVLLFSLPVEMATLIPSGSENDIIYMPAAFKQKSIFEPWNLPDDGKDAKNITLDKLDKTTRTFSMRKSLESVLAKSLDTRKFQFFPYGKKINRTTQSANAVLDAVYTNDSACILVCEGYVQAQLDPTQLEDFIKHIEDNCPNEFKETDLPKLTSLLKEYLNLLKANPFVKIQDVASHKWVNLISRYPINIEYFMADFFDWHRPDFEKVNKSLEKNSKETEKLQKYTDLISYGHYMCESMMKMVESRNSTDFDIFHDIIRKKIECKYNGKTDEDMLRDAETFNKTVQSVFQGSANALTTNKHNFFVSRFGEEGSFWRFICDTLTPAWFLKLHNVVEVQAVCNVLLVPYLNIKTQESFKIHSENKEEIEHYFKLDETVLTKACSSKPAIDNHLKTTKLTRTVCKEKATKDFDGIMDIEQRSKDGYILLKKDSVILGPRTKNLFVGADSNYARGLLMHFFTEKMYSSGATLSETFYDKVDENIADKIRTKIIRIQELSKQRHAKNTYTEKEKIDVYKSTLQIYAHVFGIDDMEDIQDIQKLYPVDSDAKERTDKKDWYFQSAAKFFRNFFNASKLPISTADDSAKAIPYIAQVSEEGQACFVFNGILGMIWEIETNTKYKTAGANATMLLSLYNQRQIKDSRQPVPKRARREQITEEKETDSPFSEMALPKLGEPNSIFVWLTKHGTVEIPAGVKEHIKKSEVHKFGRITPPFNTSFLIYVIMTFYVTHTSKTIQFKDVYAFFLEGDISNENLAIFAATFYGVMQIFSTEMHKIPREVYCEFTTQKKIKCPITDDAYSLETIVLDVMKEIQKIEFSSITPQALEILNSYKISLEEFYDHVYIISKFLEDENNSFFNGSIKLFPTFVKNDSEEAMEWRKLHSEMNNVDFLKGQLKIIFDTL